MIQVHRRLGEWDHVLVDSDGEGVIASTQCPEEVSAIVKFNEAIGAPGVFVDRCPCLSVRTI